MTNTPRTTALTATQRAALIRVRDNGPLAWCAGSRAGGAVSRMFDRLAEKGLVTKPPHEITEAGRRALQ